MKSILRIALAVALCAGISSSVSAQISGIVSIPSLDYPTLDSAFKALNLQGVGAGGVTINMTVDETAPAGGYRLGSATLNSSLTATKPLVLKGNNRQITGQVGTGSTDGVFLLSGTDYVTFDSLKVVATGGSTDTQKIEWGFALLKRNATAPYDGCQNVTIRNCTIKLGGADQSTGIYLSHSLAASGSTILSFTGAVAGDANSNIVVTRDSLLGAVRGVYAVGIGADGVRDYNNVVGGVTAADGNLIVLAPTPGTTGNGVYVAYDSVLSVRNNNFQNAVAQAGNFNHVELGNSKGNIGIRNNRFDISNAGTTNMAAAFYSSAPGTLSNNGFNDTTGTFTFSDNNITGSNANATTGNAYGFRTVGLNARTAVVSNNTVTNFNWGSATYSGNMYCLDYINGAADSLNVSGNTISNITKNGAGTSSLYTSTFRNSGGAGTRGLTYESNVIQRVVADNDLFGHYVESRATLNQATKSRFNRVDSVYISKPAVAGSFTSYLSSKGQNSDVSSNSIKRISNAFGVNVDVYWAQGDQAPSVHNNVVDSISGGTGTIKFNVDATANGGSYYEDTVRNVTNIAGMTYGVYFTPLASTAAFNVYNNTITKLNKTGLGSSRHRGIFCGGAGPMNLYNNTVSDLVVNASYTGGAMELVGIYLGGTSAYRLFHNTVKIATTGSATTFSATGLYYESSVTNLLLRNSLINVNCVPAGTGTVVAVRRSTGAAGTAPTNLNDTTNNNVYFVADTPNAYWYAEGILASSAVNAFRIATDANVNGSCSSSYKMFMAPRERSTFIENNLVAVGTNGLYAPTGASYAKRNAVRQSGLSAITNDQVGTARPGAADVGTLQFTGTPLDGTAPTITYISTPANFCYTDGRIVTVIKDTSGIRRGANTLPRLYYIKTTNANTFAVPNTAAGNGWKWVEATIISGDTFSFVPNYAILNGGVTAGTSIAYFVIAQDSAVIPNVTYRTTTFPAGYCPAGVSLAAAPPVTSTPPNSVTVTFSDKTVTPQGPTTFCAKNAVSATNILTNTVTLKAVVGANLTYQWKRGTTVLTGETKDSIVTSTAGDYTVVISNTVYGCKDSSTAITVTITPGPATLITPFKVASACATDSVRLVTNNAAGLTYNWYRNDTLIAGATDSFYFASLSGSYKARVSSGPLCNNITDTPTVVTITTSTLPPATITAQGPVTFCDGDSVTLKANTATGYLYQWRLNGVAIAGATDSVYKAKLTGAYTVRITAVNGCPRISAATTVTVNALPTATITGTASFCAGTSTNLMANSGTGLTYQWKIGGVNVATGGTSATYVASVAGSYTVLVTNANGCMKLSAATVVTLNPLPVITITSAPANASVCMGATATLTGNTVAGRTYQWLLNNAPITGATSISYGATTAGSYRLKAIITATGCTDTSAAINVVIFSLPTVTVTATGSSPICSIDSIRLAAVAGATSGTVTYQWRFNGTAIPGATDSVYFAKNNSGAYTVRVTNDNGCIAISAAFNLVVNPTPFTNITYNSPLAFCEGGAVVLTAQTPTTATIRWYKNGVAGAASDTFRFKTVYESGMYTIRAVSPAGCLFISAPVTVTVYPLPIPSITRSNDTLFAGPQSYFAYQWYRNGNLISGANNNFYKAPANGGYAVRVITGDGCEATSGVFNFSTIGITTTVAKGAIKMYPNPTTGIVKVESPVAVDILVRDATGRIVRTLKSATEVDFADLADGLYLVYLTDVKSHELLLTDKITKVSR